MFSQRARTRTTKGQKIWIVTTYHKGVITATAFSDEQDALEYKLHQEKTNKCWEVSFIASRVDELRGFLNLK